MAPGLVYPQTHDGGQRFPSYDERVTAATPPSSHASPVLRAVALDARPFAPSTGEQQRPMEGTADVEGLVEKLHNAIHNAIETTNKAMEIQNEHARQFDNLMHAYPRLSRAYSEGSLPAPTTKDAATGSSPPHARPEAGAAPKSAARYQATVEDCTESEAEADCPTPASSDGRLTPSPSGTKDSKPADQDKLPARRHTISASAPTSPSATHAVVAGASSPPTIVKEVRFADRPPSVLQRSASARYPGGGGGASSQQQTRWYQPQTRDRAAQPLQDDRWGILFTPQGKATARMRDALRGLAMHMIEAYKPTHSLIVTPEKLHRFYSRYGLDREDVNLIRMFSLTSRDAMENLERVFLSLNCEFHLVQDSYSAGGRPRRPYIPALTPEGFVQWSITLIRACPDHEAARLARVFADLDLEARPEAPPSPGEADDAQRGRRRLPRQISRHLLPAEPNASELRLLTDTVRQWRYATEAAPASHSPDRPQPPPPLPSSSSNKPLIHSDARSRQEHLHRPRKEYDYDYDYERDASAVMVPQGGARKDREYRSSGGSSSSSSSSSSRYALSKSHARGESPRRGSSKRYDRRERDGKEPERDRRRGERRWSADSYDEPRHRRRDARGSRA